MTRQAPLEQGENKVRTTYTGVESNGGLVNAEGAELQQLLEFDGEGLSHDGRWCCAKLRAE